MECEVSYLNYLLYSTQTIKFYTFDCQLLNSDYSIKLLQLQIEALTAGHSEISTRFLARYKVCSLILALQCHPQTFTFY